MKKRQIKNRVMVIVALISIFVMFTGSDVSAQEVSKIQIKERNQRLLISGELNIESVENAYPGMESIVPEAIQFENQTQHTLNIQIKLTEKNNGFKSWSNLFKFSFTEENKELPKKESINAYAESNLTVKAMSDKKIGYRYQLAGEQMNNYFQNKSIPMFFSVYVQQIGPDGEVISSQIFPNETGKSVEQSVTEGKKGRLPQLNEAEKLLFFAIGVLSLGLFILVICKKRKNAQLTKVRRE